MGFDKEFNSECLEGENSGVERDAESNDIPIRFAEFENVLVIKLFSLCLPQIVFSLGACFQKPVNHRAGHADHSEDHRNKQRPLPVLVIGLGPGGRIQRGKRT